MPLYCFLILLSLALSAKAQAPAQPFWWGVGNASFQVEGHPADSDWKDWTQLPNRIKDGTDADQATDFWNSYEKDFKLAEELGSNMFRLSVAWERIQPSANEFNEEAFSHYEKILLNMRQHHLEPMVTLYHFVTPAWLAQEGGMTSPRFAEYFANYAASVVRRLSLGPAKVKWWMTINEPLVPIAAGYILGIWPPGRKDIFDAYKAAHHLIDAQNLAIQKIHSDKALPQDLKFSVAYHWRDIHTQGFGVFSSWAQSILNYLANTWFLNSIHAERDLNYLGINYYGRYVLHFQWTPPFLKLDEGDGDKTDLGWTIYPEGLGTSLIDAYNSYHLPILISENGLADASDSKRAQFLKTHIAEIKKAQQKNIPVIGYLHWSLTDNFEWAEGLTPRFGLVEMDYVKMQRKPRPSFKVYKDIIKNF